MAAPSKELPVKKMPLPARGKHAKPSGHEVLPCRSQHGKSESEASAEESKERGVHAGEQMAPGVTNHGVGNARVGGDIPGKRKVWHDSRWALNSRERRNVVTKRTIRVRPPDAGPAACLFGQESPLMRCASMTFSCSELLSARF